MLPARPVFPLGFKAIRLQLFQSLFIRFPFARFPFRVYFGSLLKLWCCFRHFNYNTPNKSEAAFVIESHATPWTAHWLEKSSLPQLARNQFNFNSINDFARVAGSQLSKGLKFGPWVLYGTHKIAMPRSPFIYAHEAYEMEGLTHFPHSIWVYLGRNHWLWLWNLSWPKTLRKNGMINVRGAAKSLNPLRFKFAYIPYWLNTFSMPEQKKEKS